MGSNPTLSAICRRAPPFATTTCFNAVAAAALELPVLVVHGDRDVSAPIEASAYRYAAIIPRAELIVYEGVAHGLMVTHAARLAADLAQRIGR